MSKCILATIIIVTVITAGYIVGNKASEYVDTVGERTQKTINVWEQCK